MNIKKIEKYLKEKVISFNQKVIYEKGKCYEMASNSIDLQIEHAKKQGNVIQPFFYLVCKNDKKKYLTLELVSEKVCITEN